MDEKMNARKFKPQDKPGLQLCGPPFSQMREVARIVDVTFDIK